MILYHHPDGVEAIRIDDRPVLTTRQGGKIAVDRRILALWNYADGKKFETILAEFNPGSYPAGEIQAGLACMAEAGLLLREIKTEPEEKFLENAAGPLVSIIVVLHNSRDWLPDCLESISRQTYMSIELVLVDNASNDGAQEWISSNFPEAKYLRINESTSFAKAINIGVEASEGDFILLLNPDTILDFGVVAEMVAKAEENARCGAVAAKLKFLWAPGFINGIGNRVAPFSWGMDNGLGHLDLGQLDDWGLLPSACFAAALIPRLAWEKVGPADDQFPMYYEDSEWSYRARKQGFTIRAAPKATVLHGFGGRMPAGERNTLNAKKLENVVYGRLRFTTKLLDGYLGEYLISYLAVDLFNLIRYLLTLKIDLVQSILRGYRKFFKDLPEIRTARKELIGNQVVKDKSIFAPQRGMPETIIWHGLPELTWDLVRNYYLPAMMAGKTRPMREFAAGNSRPKLLIVSHDVIDEKIAGPGMRYLELGRALSSAVDVTIAVPNEPGINVPGIKFNVYFENQPGKLQKLADVSDILLVSSYLINRFPFLGKSQARLVVDLYDPFVLENLHYYLDEPLKSQESLNQQSVAFTNQLARIGDFFICGNERQRDFWLGVLTANGRVNPRNYQADSQLRSLIDVVGIGYPDRPIEMVNLLRGIHPSVPVDSQIILWGGGIWNWLDPLTVIKAWPTVVTKFPNARLVFLGTRHPNPDIPVHRMADLAQSYAEEIGEKDRSILFIEWLSYQDREALLSEADIGVSLHPIHIETRYSIRTRILDYIWARLPILCTEGDITSEWVGEFGLGYVVPPNDVRSVEQALLSMLERSKESWSQQFEMFGEAFNWQHVADPLRQYCLNGSYAADRLDRTKSRGNDFKPGGGWRLKWARARFILRSEGARGLAHRTWRYLQRTIANL